MIHSLAISNFLSHKKSKLVFSEGVNVIVGPTDSGKSAIIKALKWVTFNRPMGDGMRSSWGGDTFVKIKTDGPVVGRGKVDKTNGYFIGEDIFEAVKGDVPDEIQKALNLTDINFQTQFDSHFLLSSSSGDVAQYFNKVAHLDKIDVALQNIQRWTKDTQKKLQYDQQSLQTNQEKLSEFTNVTAIEKILTDLERKDKEGATLVRDRAGLLSTVAAIKIIEGQLEEITFLEELSDNVNKLLVLFKQEKDLRIDLNTLQTLIKSITDIAREEKELQDVLALSEETFHKALGKGSVCPLCEQIIK